MYEILKIENITLKEIFDIDNVDLLLFVKSLACLFGDANNVVNNKSIKFENNFRKLMQQKYLETDLLETDFVPLLDLSLSKDNLTQYIDNLHSQNKVNELVKRFDYFNTNEDLKIKGALIVVCILYERSNIYNLYEYTLLKTLNELANKFLSNNDDKSKISTWIENNVFSKLSDDKLITLISDIWKANHFTGDVWGFDQNQINEISLNSYKNYLKKLKEVTISPSDYSLYQIYHSIKIIDNLKNQVVSLFIEFWDTDNLELLCAQTTDIGSFSVLTFKISDTVDEIFGSRNKYISFVKSINVNNTAINEFLILYELSAITNHSKAILFEFKNSSLMLSKIRNITSSPNRIMYRDYDNITQVILECNDEQISHEVSNNSELRLRYNIDQFIYENKFYILFDVKNIEIGSVNKLFEDINTEVIFLEGRLNKNNQPLYNYNEKYIKIKSIQPSLT